MVVTEETGTFLQKVLGNIGFCGVNACRIVLRCECTGGSRERFQFSRMMKCLEALAYFFPSKELLSDEIYYFRLLKIMIPAKIHLLSCLNLNGTQLIFISVMAVHSINGKSCIRIPLPSAAKIKLVIDASNAIVA